MLVSVVFSFKNEEAVLPLLVAEMKKVFDTIEEDWELIFVNDASTDRSVDILKEEAVKLGAGRLKVVEMSRCFGVEESFLAGIEHARGDAIILMYTDMQDPPSVILEMLAEWRKGADIVHTVRKKRVGEPLSKIVAAHIAYRVIDWMSNIQVPHDSGDFKLITRRVANILLDLKEPEPYLRGLIPWIGFKQARVYYDLMPRVAGQSKVALFGSKARAVLLSGLTSFSVKPTMFILEVGIFGTGLSTLAGILFLIAALFGKANATLGLVLLALFLWSTLVLAIGIVGYYISRVFKNTLGRPRYIVREVLEL
jgi:glycosyltransferase involved in cell wall biosynthesis